MTASNMNYLVGKTIDHIDCSVHEEFALVHFTDKTMWLITAETHNFGAKLEQKISHGHHEEYKEESLMK